MAAIPDAKFLNDRDQRPERRPTTPPRPTTPTRRSSPATRPSSSSRTSTSAPSTPPARSRTPARQARSSRSAGTSARPARRRSTQGTQIAALDQKWPEQAGVRRARLRRLPQERQVLPNTQSCCRSPRRTAAGPRATSQASSTPRRRADATHAAGPGDRPGRLPSAHAAWTADDPQVPGDAAATATAPASSRRRTGSGSAAWSHQSRPDRRPAASPCIVVGAASSAIMPSGLNVDVDNLLGMLRAMSTIAIMGARAAAGHRRRRDRPLVRRRCTACAPTSLAVLWIDARAAGLRRDRRWRSASAIAVGLFNGVLHRRRRDPVVHRHARAPAP